MIFNKIIKKFLPSQRLAFLALSNNKALKRISGRGIGINTVIDVGASDGRWSEESLSYYPRSNYLLIDGNHNHEKSLIQFKKKYSGNKIDYEITVVGDKQGLVYFDSSDLFGGVASEEKVNDSFIEQEVNTIDNLVKRRNLLGPYLVKLDTHGYEIPILNGAQSVLESTNVLIIEAYNFKITENSLRFHEMISYVEELGFRCADISEPMFREKDGVFWQIDFYFLRNDNPVFDSNTYD